MDARALLRINAQEEHFLPVELKVRMLMEQAAMRMRASAMVGERISKLDDVIRVRALLAIIREKSRGPEEAAPAAAAATATAKEQAPAARGGAAEKGTQAAAPPAEVAVCVGEHTGGSSPPDAEDAEMFARMAVSAMKTVLFQVADEGAAESAKDVLDVYEGLMTTDDLALAAAEGFPELCVETLMSLKHSCYRKLVAARHRFLVSCFGRRLQYRLLHG